MRHSLFKSGGSAYLIFTTCLLVTVKLNDVANNGSLMSYSYLNVFAGFVIAALIVCELTVISASNIAPIAANK